MTLGKRASTLRVVGSRNSDPKIAEMEEEFKELGNSIGMGAMGFVGKNMVIDCNIEVGYCHTGGMPMSVGLGTAKGGRRMTMIFHRKNRRVGKGVFARQRAPVHPVTILGAPS